MVSLCLTNFKLFLSFFDRFRKAKDKAVHFLFPLKQNKMNDHTTRRCRRRPRRRPCNIIVSFFVADPTRPPPIPLHSDR